MASERELVLALLDPDASDTRSTSHKYPKGVDSEYGKTETDLTFVLDRIFEGVCRPFKVRVEQVLHSQPNLIISYKLSNTLEFYLYTVSRNLLLAIQSSCTLLFKLSLHSTLFPMQISDLLGEETSLCNTLLVLKDAAQKTFFDILKSRGEKLLRYPPLVAVDLSPPPALREGVSVLLEIIQTHDSMMFPASGKKPDFDPAISALLDPIIQVSVHQVTLNK